ncbi:unnamed protein product [Amaranthus hypochondriacus]
MAFLYSSPTAAFETIPRAAPVTTTTPNMFAGKLLRHLFPKNFQPTSKISCKIVIYDDCKNSKFTDKLNRRDVLIGLTSMCGAAITLSDGSSTLAAPGVYTPGDVENSNCSPLLATNTIDFVVPPTQSTLRAHPLAYSVDEQYHEKFSRAISLMKALPANDPRFHSLGSICMDCLVYD